MEIIVGIARRGITRLTGAVSIICVRFSGDIPFIMGISALFDKIK